MRRSSTTAVIALAGLSLACPNKEPETPEQMHADAKTCFQALDASQLGSVLDCFYGPEAPGRYGLLSKPSRPQVEEQAFEASYPKNGVEVKPESLGVEDKNGFSWSRVSVTTHDGTKNCTDVSTDTWVMEGKKWRRVLAPKLEAEARQKLAAGDDAGALSAADRWLQQEPFSEAAYEVKATAALHLAKAANKPPPADLTAKMLAINPKDSLALQTTILLSPDATAAKAAFQKLPPDACNRAAAAKLVASFLPEAERKPFLDSAGVK